MFRESLPWIFGGKRFAARDFASNFLSLLKSCNMCSVIHHWAVFRCLVLVIGANWATFRTRAGVTLRVSFVFPCHKACPSTMVLFRFWHGVGQSDSFFSRILWFMNSTWKDKQSKQSILPTGLHQHRSAPTNSLEKYHFQRIWRRLPFWWQYFGQLPISISLKRLVIPRVVVIRSRKEMMRTSGCSRFSFWATSQQI